ncbi:MAG: tripartite tricarboxylate transporter substrate binding protein [Rhodospirillales bacterium]
MFNRRAFLTALGATSLAWPGLAGAANDGPVTLLLPYPGGAFDAIVRALSGPLSQALGREVAIERVPGDGGWEVLARLQAGDPASTLLADADLTLAVKQVMGGRDFNFDSLTPVAKLTDGFSVALIAPAGAVHARWAGLVEALAERKVKLATTGKASAYGVAELLWGSVFKGEFEEVRAPGPQAIFDAVVGGQADLGLVTTNLLEGFNAAATQGQAVPVMTFGAKRSPRYPDTPTLAEISGDDKNDFTIALGLFASKAAPADMVKTVAAALAKAQQAPALASAPVQKNFPITLNDAEVLRQSFARSLRLLTRLQGAE